MGQLGSGGGVSGRVRAPAQKSKALQRASKHSQQRRNITGNQNSGASQSGTASSLSFTPAQGIELADPNSRAPSLGTGEGTDSVFSEKRGFSKVASNKVARDLKH
jgi:U4/U6 small nuclear ribonucleoprotein PRP31